MFYVGLCLFFGPHGAMLIQPIRQRIQTFIPTALYLALFSLMSLFGLGLIVVGYDPNLAIEAPSLPWVVMLSPWLMFAAFFCLIAANVPGWTRYRVQHPMSLGGSLWALMHLAVNPDLHAWLMFGCFFILVVTSAMTASRRQKNKPKPAPRWIFDGLTLGLASGVTFCVYTYHGALFGIGLS